MKNILLLVHDDEGQEARLQAALDVARIFEGHLTCLDVALLPVAAGDYWNGEATAILLDDERRRESKNRSEVEKRLEHEGVAWNWIDATGELSSCLERAATLSELIVVNRRLDSYSMSDMRSVAADVVIRSGKPVLAMPEKAKGLQLMGAHALVAWNGSRQSDAALQAAVPFLKLAGRVTIFEVNDGSVGVPAEEAAAFLSRYDVHAKVVRTAPRGRFAEEIILDEIKRLGIDYVVMGGFGHSRFREALVGGVSRKMLTVSPVPLFLVH